MERKLHREAHAGGLELDVGARAEIVGQDPLEQLHPEAFPCGHIMLSIRRFLDPFEIHVPRTVRAGDIPLHADLAAIVVVERAMFEA